MSSVPRLGIGLSAGLLLGSPPALAQAVCLDGANKVACVNRSGTTLFNIIGEASVTNAGTVLISLQTTTDGSTVTNSGNVGNDLTTTGNGSSVTNSGSVAFAIETFGTNATVGNSGSVTFSIETHGSGSSITNSGSVGTSLLTSGPDASVTNSGTAGSIFTGHSGSHVTNAGTVSGIIATLGANSNVTNSGTVAIFISTSNSGSSVTNSGTVGHSILTLRENSSVTNSGSVGSGLLGDGIFINGNDPTLTLLAGSVIQGNIDLAGSGTRTLNLGPGLNAVLTFTTPPDAINGSGAPIAVSGNQVAVVDPTALAQQPGMLADLTSGIFNSIYAHLAGGGASADGFGGMQLGMTGPMQLGAGATVHSGPDDTGPTTSFEKTGVWALGFGGQHSNEAKQPTVRSATTYFGGIAGIDGRVAPGVVVGGFGGMSHSALDVPVSSESLDAESYFGGGYASLQGNGLFTQVMLAAGHTDYDNSRQIANNLAQGGVQQAKASYSGNFVSPEFTLGTSVRIGGLTIEPSARGRYAFLAVDGYAETGAVSNFTVGSRDVSLWLGRLQLAVPFKSEQGTFSPRFGVEGWTSDAGAISAVLLGQAISFDPGGNSEKITGFVGVTATSKLGPGASAFVDGEVHAGSDGIDHSEARGGVRISF